MTGPPSPPDPPAHAAAPRPLGLHLWVGAMTWMSSPGASIALKSASHIWSEVARAAEKNRPAPGPEADGPSPSEWARLAHRAAGVDGVNLARAVEAEARRRFATFLAGVRRYQGAARPARFSAGSAGPEPFRREGTTTVWDYGGTGRPVLLIPSLVNRAYILDLNEEASLCRYLRRQGFRVFLVDWDAPGELEMGFDLDDYIARRLGDVLERIAVAAGCPVPLVGYCMGGNLSLALALRKPAHVAGGSLLATPWDFRTPDGGPTIPPAVLAALAPMIERLGHLPVDGLQSLFALLDPQLVLRKFAAFAALENSDRLRDFLHLEDWLNDGVALAGKVAKECLLGWYGENTPAEGRWRVAGVTVDPSRLEVPTQVMIPAKDRIVPPPSARALARQLPSGAEVLTPSLGHIGMIVGRRAPAQVWAPLSRWLGEIGRS